MSDVFTFAVIVLALVAWFVGYRRNQPELRILSFGLLVVAAVGVFFSSQATDVSQQKPQSPLALNKPAAKPVKPIAIPIVKPQSVPVLEPEAEPIATNVARPLFTVAYPLRVLFGNAFDNTQFEMEFRGLEKLVANGAWAEVETARNRMFVRMASSRMTSATDLEAPFDMLAGIALLEQGKARLAIGKFKSAIKSYEVRSGSQVEIVRARIELVAAVLADGGEAVELSGNLAGLLMQNKSQHLHELTLLYRVRSLLARANNQSNLAQTYSLEARKFAAEFAATDPARSKMLLALLEE